MVRTPDHRVMLGLSWLIDLVSMIIMSDSLSVGIFSFTASAQLADNHKRICAAIDEASRHSVRLLVTPECALVGYPSAARSDLQGISWSQVADAEESICEHARRLNIAIVLGSAGPVADGSGISNDALACGRWVRPALRQGAGLIRYRKCHLTPTDTKHFVSGDAPGVFAIDDWCIGMGICFDVRVPSFWANLAKAGCDLFCCIGHMAGHDPDPGTKAQVIPALFAARAAEWATPMLLANTSSADRYLDSAHWDARGVRVQSIADGFIITEVKRRDHFDPWYGDLRRHALAAWKVDGGVSRESPI